MTFLNRFKIIIIYFYIYFFTKATIFMDFYGYYKIAAFFYV